MPSPQVPHLLCVLPPAAPCAGVGEQCRRAHGRSAVRHHRPWTASWPSPETARQRAGALRFRTGSRALLQYGSPLRLDNNRKLQKASLALPALLACLPCRCDPSDTCAGPSRNDPIVLDVSRISTTVWQRWPVGCPLTPSTPPCRRVLSHHVA